MPEELSRRQLLQAGMGAALIGLTSEKSQSAPAKQPQLPTRLLGRTGAQVTIFGLGGASAKTPLSNGPEEQALAIISRALDLGVNYFDTASTYGDWRSETYLGKVAKTRRKEMFLASKTAERTYDGAMRELEQSLKRLQTDHLDLWQMHHVSLPDRDTVPAFGKNGAIKALDEAKRQKLVRFVGVTGHHEPDILADWLRRYPFDTLLTAVNAGDVHQPRPFIKNLLPVARERKVGIIAMKIPAYGQLLNPGAGVSIREAMHYTLSQPGIACGIISCDSLAMLEENVATARAFAPLSAQAQAKIESSTAGYWPNAAFYRQWT